MIDRIWPNNRTDDDEYWHQRALWERQNKPRAERRIHANKKFRAELFGLQDGLCWYCGDPLNEFETAHIEHQTPISRGGDDAPENVVMACVPCNMKKRTKTLEEYREFIEAITGEEVIFHGERT